MCVRIYCQWNNEVLFLRVGIQQLMTKTKPIDLGCVLAHKRAEQLGHVQNDEADAALLVRVGLINN